MSGVAAARRRPRSQETTVPGAGDELSMEDVRGVARLARLAPTDAQLEAARWQLAAVLGHARRLQGLDLVGVEPLSHPVEAVNRLAEDVPGPTIPTEVFMAMAPETEPPFLKVPKVLGDGGA